MKYLSNSKVIIGLLFISISALIFKCTSLVLSYFIPKSAQNTPRQAWKWKNIVISLIHSFIAGLWAVASFYWHPEMAEDLINAYSINAHILVSFSVGYFFHDLFDITLNHRKKSSFELMVHHAFVITCFGLSIFTQLYIGYSVVALLVEVNSVFLHARQLFIIVSTPKSNFWYRLNALMNIFTYIIFRIAVLGWMTRWLVLHRDNLPFHAYALGSIGLAVIVLMNIVLFIRICSVDFYSKKQLDVLPPEQEVREQINQKETEATSTSSSHRRLISSTRNFHMD